MFDDDLKVAELQFWSSVGLNYISKTHKIANVTAYHTSR